MEKIEKTLVDNHLAFLSSHRGSIRFDGDTVFIESDRQEFTYAILGHDSRVENLPSSVQSIQYLPWSQTSVGDLKLAGFSPG